MQAETRGHDNPARHFLKIVETHVEVCMISIRIAQENYYPKAFKFPGGEVNIQLPSRLPGGQCDYIVKAKIKSSDDLMELLLVKNALDIKYHDHRSALKIPYLPYARQDRACNAGEALSIKVMANLINSMGFCKVLTCDNHSDVSTALINNCENYTPERLMAPCAEIEGLLTKTRISLCCPDAGAAKKVYSVSKTYGGIPVIMADKIRDVATGDITHTEVYCDDLGGQSVMVIDDICDGGLTFIKLAEKLREKGAGPIFLYVTHGIFSKGIGALSMYSRIYTTDSFASVEDGSDKLHVIKL